MTPKLRFAFDVLLLILGAFFFLPPPPPPWFVFDDVWIGFARFGGLMQISSFVFV